VISKGASPKTVGEIESFVAMLLAACDDKKIYNRLEPLLALPDERRRSELNAWLTDLMIADAPRDLMVALACLTDDKVAEKTYEVIYKCHRK
jgi:hypothetical protein